MIKVLEENQSAEIDYRESSINILNKMKIIQVILIILQLFVIKIVVAPAQKVSEISDAKTAYDLLLTRFKIYIEYYTLSEETKQL